MPPLVCFLSSSLRIKTRFPIGSTVSKVSAGSAGQFFFLYSSVLPVFFGTDGFLSCFGTLFGIRSKNLL
jgi:hypothetical protein